MERQSTREVKQIILGSNGSGSSAMFIEQSDVEDCALFYDEEV